MSTKSEIEELWNVDGDRTNQIIIKDMLFRALSLDFLESCIKDDLTDEEYNIFKKNYEEALEKCEKSNYSIHANEFENMFEKLYPYFDTDKLYLFLDDFADYYKKTTSIHENNIYEKHNLVVRNKSVEKIKDFINNEQDKRKIGKNGKQKIILYKNNNTIYMICAIKGDLLVYNSDAMEGICKGLTEDEFYDLMKNDYAKRMFKKMDFEYVKKQFLKGNNLQLLMDRSKLDKRYLNYFFDNYYIPEDLPMKNKIQDIAFGYDSLKKIKENIDIDNKTRENKINIDNESKKIDEFFNENVNNLLKNKAEFYNEIINAKSSDIKNFRKTLIEKNVINSEDAEIFLKVMYSKSKVNNKELEKIIKELNENGLKIDLKNFEYNITKHAQLFMQNHTDEIKKICNENEISKSDKKENILSSLNKNNTQEENKINNLSNKKIIDLNKANELYFKKIYEEKMLNADKVSASKLAEDFAYEIANINENFIYKNYEGIKYLYKNGYLDFNSVREFLEASELDPRDKNDPINLLKKDGIQIRDEDNIVDIIKQYQLYEVTKGKKGISGKKIIDNYLSGKIENENFDLFINTAKTDGTLEKLFTSDVISKYLMDAEQENDNEKNIYKYNIYKQYFDKYASKDEKKSFDNTIKSKLKNVNYSNKKDCITKYKLHVLTAENINNEYNKIESKMETNQSNNVLIQLENLDDLITEMIKEQSVLTDKDVQTIFLDGTLTKNKKKKRLTRIFDSHTSEDPDNKLTHQQKLSLVIKMEPPENEYFRDYLKIENPSFDYEDIHNNDDSEKIVDDSKNKIVNKNKVRHTKEFYYRKKYLESLDKDISTDIYGDVVAFDLPNKHKVIIEQCLYSAKDNTMNVTDKATYILPELYFENLKNDHIANYINGVPYDLFYQDREKNKRISWSILSSLKDRDDVKRVMHVYKSDSWEKNILKKLGFTEKEAKSYIENYKREREEKERE